MKREMTFFRGRTGDIAVSWGFNLKLPQMQQLHLHDSLVLISSTIVSELNDRS